MQATWSNSKQVCMCPCVILFRCSVYVCDSMCAAVLCVCCGCGLVWLCVFVWFGCVCVFMCFGCVCVCFGCVCVQSAQPPWDTTLFTFSVAFSSLPSFLPPCPSGTTTCQRSLLGTPAVIVSLWFVYILTCDLPLCAGTLSDIFIYLRLKWYTLTLSWMHSTSSTC